MWIDRDGRDDEAKEEGRDFGCGCFPFSIHRETRGGWGLLDGCMGGRYCCCFLVMCWLERWREGRRRMRCCFRGSCGAVRGGNESVEGVGCGRNGDECVWVDEEVPTVIGFFAGLAGWLASSLFGSTSTSTAQSPTQTLPAAPSPNLISSIHRRRPRSLRTERPGKSLLYALPANCGGLCCVGLSFDDAQGAGRLQWVDERTGWLHGCIYCR